MVPSGYRHLITKDDLVEEEYNFKVPLIRCWRLTSLETLNSNPANNVNVNVNDHHNHYNISNEFPSSGAASNARRKTLSLFNSLSISGNNNNNNNNNINNSAAAAAATTNGRSFREQPKQGSHTNGNQNGTSGGTLMGSGTGGSSLLAALVGNANGFHGLGLSQTNGSSSGSSQRTNGSFRADGHRCPGGAVQPFSQYELSFEYLVSKDTLRWITISSDQAIFISISLQGVVDELVSKRDGNSSLYQSQSEQSSIIIDPVGSAGCHTPNKAKNNHNQQSFSYLYRDGRQKALNTNNQQLIDKFGTTLGYSPMNSSVLALARQRQQSLRSSSSSSSFLSTGSRFAFLGTSASSDSTNADHHQHQQYTSLEISHLKKAPSPIINDAFEGMTNDDDL